MRVFKVNKNAILSSVIDGTLPQSAPATTIIMQPTPTGGTNPKARSVIQASSDINHTRSVFYSSELLNTRKTNVCTYPEFREKVDNKNVHLVSQFDPLIAPSIVMKPQSGFVPYDPLVPITQRSVKRTSYRKVTTGKVRPTSFAGHANTNNIGEWKRQVRLASRDLDTTIISKNYPSKHYLVPQGMFDGLTAGVSVDKEFSDAITSLSETLSNGVDVNHNLDTELTSILATLSSKVAQDGVPINVNVGVGEYASLSSKIAYFIALISSGLYHYSRGTKESIAIFLGILSIGVLTQNLITIPGFSDLSSYVTTYLSSIDKVTPQIGASTFENILSSLMIMLIAIAAGESKKAWAPEIVSQLFSYKRNVESVSSCVKAIVTVFETIVTYVRRDVLGGSSFTFLETNREDVNDFITKVTELSDDLHHQRFPATQANATLIHEMWLDSQTLLGKLPKGTDQGIITRVTQAYNFLSSQKKIFDGMNLTLNGSRIEPTSVLFVGPPGTGKSSLLYPLTYEYLARRLPADKLDQFKAAPNSFIYNRQAECVYWDGYNMDKWVCFIDDLGQMRDVAGNPDNEWMNWIRMCSTFNYVLHMAALEKKGNVYFQSRLVVANTNLKTFNVESIVEIEAFRRRVDRCYLCVPKIEFCKPETTDKGLWGRRLDGSKLPIGPLGITELTPDTSDFFEIDPMSESGVETGRILTYPEVLEELISITDMKEKRYNQTQLYLNKILDKNAVAPQGWFSDKTKIQMSSIGDVIEDDDSDTAIRILNEISSTPDCEQKLVMLIGAYSQFYGNSTSIHETIKAFIRSDPSFYNVSTKTDDDFFDYIDTFQFKPIEETISFLKPTPILNDLVEYIKSKYIQITELYSKSKNWLVLHGPSCVKSIFDIVEKYSFVLALVVGLPISAMVFKYIWNKVALFFGSEALTFSPEMYSGKPQRERNTAKKNKIASKDLRTRISGRNVPLAQQSATSFDKTNDDIIRKIHKRCCYELWLPDQNQRIGIVTFVKGRSFIMPKHFAETIFQILEEHEQYANATCTFKKCGSDVTYHVLLADMLNIVSGTSLDSLDLVVVQAPKEIPVHTDITSYFLSEKEIGNLPRIFDFRLYIPSVDQQTNWMGVSTKTNNELINCEVSYTVSKTFRYRAMTQEGDCGAIFTTLNKASGKSKLCGIHVAGNTLECVGLSCVISREELTANIPEDEISFAFESEVLPQASHDIVLPQFTPQYVLPKPVSSPGVTNIIKSPLYNAWMIAKTRPSRLTPKYLEDGTVADPFIKAISGYCTPTPYIRPRIIEDIGIAIFDHLEHASKINVDRRLFTIKEAIIGLEGEPDFGSISRSTSMGYPYVLKKGRKMPGKTEAFGTEQEYNLETPLAKQLIIEIEDIERDCKSGIRSAHLYVDCLKDERRPLEKVAAMKTRAFSICPFNLLVLYRRYFGAFILWCHKNRIDNGFATGVNPYSEEWELIAQKLNQFAQASYPNKGAGDYSGFDSKQKPVVHNDILIRINDWYDDDFAEVREILWLEITNSFHLYKDTVYSWDSSGPSGHPLTTLVNNLYNHYIALYVWYKSHDFELQALYEFYDHVYYITLGDDNLFSVRPTHLIYFSEKLMEQNVGDLGMKYTSETKKEVAEVMRPLTEVSFLKRMFRKEPVYDRYCGPLELDVILEMPMWTRSTQAHAEIVEANVEIAMRELSLHDNETFSKWSKEIVKHSQEKINYSPKITSRLALLKVVQGSDMFY
jgi:ABC-type multidrug transport system fused ATPase/permease subunit